MLKKNKKIITLITLTIIFLYALFLRIYKIQEQSYWIDEAFTINAVLETIEKGYPLLDSGEYYSRALLNTYLTSASVSILGFNEFSTRIISLIFGVLSIYLIFLLSKKVFNTNIALLASFMTSFSYWQIAWSRQARMYTQLQFFFFLSIYLFNSLLEKFSYKKLVFLFLSTLAAILSHYFGYFLIVIYFSILTIKLLNNKEKILLFYQKVKTNKILSGFLLLLFFFLSYKLSKDFFTYILTKERNLFWEYINFIHYFFPVLYILALFGLAISLKAKPAKEKASHILLGLSFFIPFLTISLVSDLKMFRYLFFITPLIFIFFSFFIDYISKKTRWKNLSFILLSFLIIILSSSLNIRVFNFKPISHYYLEPLTPQSNFKGAYKKILDNGFDENKIIISPYSALDRIYLKRSDYCLAMSLHNDQKSKNKIKERDYYNNTPHIFKKEELEEIINKNSGYIMIDYMAIQGRLKQEIIDYIFKQELIFKDEYQLNNQVWVFKF